MFMFLKMLNVGHIGKKKMIAGVLFSVMLSFSIYSLRNLLPYGRYVLMILVLGLFMAFLTGANVDISFTVMAISVGISWGLYLVLVALFSGTLFYFINLPVDSILIVIFSALAEVATIYCFSRIRRFRKGIQFLRKPSAGAIGLIISGILLFAVEFMNHQSDKISMVLWFFPGGAFCIAGLVFWWRSGLFKLYRKNIKERDFQEYEQMLADRDAQIARLTESNEQLAKIIHRDNKLLPAMAQSVRILAGQSGDVPDAAAQAESGPLLDQIETMMRERAGLIERSRRENKILPKTGDSLIDGIFSHMLLKASEKEIDFDVSVLGELKELTASVLPAVKLHTLCADLIENAIIAASGSSCRRILVSIGIDEEGISELSVQDSGIPFEVETLQRLGLEKASTHLGDGGSGIGYMTIFEILHECGASIIITEYEPRPQGFTKSVRVRFDHRGQFVVQTYRPEAFSHLQSGGTNAMTVLTGK